MSKMTMVMLAGLLVGMLFYAGGCEEDDPAVRIEVDGAVCEVVVGDTAAWYVTEDDWEHFGMAGEGESCMFEIEAAYYDGSWDASIFFASSSGEVEDELVLDSFEFEESGGELTGAFSGVFESDDQIAVSVEFEAIPWSEDTF